MLRSSTQLCKSHGDDLGPEYLWKGMNKVLWKTVSKQSRQIPYIEDNKEVLALVHVVEIPLTVHYEIHTKALFLEKFY